MQHIKKPFNRGFYFFKYTPMTIENLHALFLSCDAVSIDTRKITDKSMFFAIKGDNFDANTFTKEALSKGASYVVIDNPDFYIDDSTILVKDSLKALQDLAQYHRSYLKLPIIALTGSNGKTTTKELIQVVLSKKFNVKATVGNLNNHIGVPLTLLTFNQKTKIGIVEMGANHQKEIEFLCEIAQPDFGYITNFGKAHLEGFGGIEGVIKGKSEMYHYFFKNNKTAFINLDDPIQEEKTTGLKTIGFSVHKNEAFVTIDAVDANPFVTVTFGGTIVQSQLIGLYNSNNINAAITIGKYFEVSDNDIKDAIEAYIPDNNRSQLLEKNSNAIILDAYNANPSSMKAAIENFIQLDKPNKIVFLGDMFELGDESLQEHRNTIALLENQKDIKCFFTGKDFYSNRTHQSNFYFFKSFEDLAAQLNQMKILNATILIKGSRGMALERIVALL
jgi:UDP-N-acetylmuramoyl-tripeptide--D-alanyl-D-alanine ligase